MTQRSTGYRIDPFDLRLFVAIVDGGSITAGARAVQLSLAAASTRLQGLEHAIGAALLRRAKRGVSLTDAGRTLLRHAGRLQRELEALHAAMAAHAHGVRSTVRVLGNTAAVSEHLPPEIGRFLARHADIDIELRELDSQDVLLALRQEQADLGIVADYVDTEGLETLPWRDDALVAVLPRGGKLKGRRSLRFAGLIGQPFVGLAAESGLARFLQRQALQQGRGLHHRVRVGRLDAVVSLVGDGVGIGIVPQATAQRVADARVVAVPLADDWARRRLLLCSAGAQRMSRAGARLLEFLAAEKAA